MTSYPPIGVISDSHDQVHYLDQMVAYFNEQRVGLVIHCGDWVAPFTLRYFTKLNAPLYGVFGNNDGEKWGHRGVGAQVKEAGLRLTMEDVFLSLNEYGKRIAVYHGTAPKLVEALVKCGDYDVVFYGHNHIAKVELVGNVLSMNPGTLLEMTNPGTGIATFGIYDPNTHTGRLVNLADLA